MHQNNLQKWQHQHSFSKDKKNIEKLTLIVVIITFAMMIAEIIFGWLTNSLALFADGWHMGTHAFALGVSAIAYVIARKNANNNKFTFGTWKIEILGAYSSAIVLGIVAIVMVYTSVERLIHPLSISYNEAIIVAVIGLIVNLICIAILNKGHNSHSDHHHKHDDLNLKSAYLHVLADSLTSVFAIIALLGAKYFSFNLLDPIMGLMGAILIGRWTLILLKDSSKILVDHATPPELSKEIKAIIEADGDSKICDLHLIQISEDKFSCIISIVTSRRYSIEHYKYVLKSIQKLAHITVEINECNTSRGS